MLITTKVKIKWNPSNKNYYENKGFIFTKFKDEFEVDVNDLYEKSSVIVQYYCDYCLENNINDIYSKDWYRYLKQRQNISKDCCGNKDCVAKKTKESIMKKYNVETPFAIPENYKKIKQSYLDRYGVEHPLQLEEFQNKRKNTCLEKLGVEHPAQNKIIHEKMKKTSLERHGFEYAAQDPEKIKIIQSKRLETMSKNNSAPCSKQQKYIHKLIGGELNYPYSRCLLDIAFPNEKIYVEYNGKGHNLNVKLGNITQEEFDINEIKREQYLKFQGWKIIRIISKEDLLPSIDILKKLINEAKNYLQSNHSWFNIDVDNSKIVCSVYEEKIDMGELKRVKI